MKFTTKTVTNIWHRYAEKMCQPPDIVVTYFGNTLDGVRSFDVHRKGQLIGIIKRNAEKVWYAWRNGHSERCDTLGKARDWIVARQEESP